MQFIIAFVLAIGLMAADHYGQILDNVRSVLLTTLTPVESVATLPKHVYKLVTTDFTSINSLEIENQQLKTEVLLLKAKQQQLTNLQLQVERLESLLGTTGKITNQTVQIATVTFYSSNPLSQFLTLNKGSLDHVKKHQTVIDSQGIVGQIIQTTPNTSRVLLITDPDHQIPVRIQRTGQRGILNGTGHDNVQLNFIPVNSEVRSGDIIESSGLGGVFPSGYPVAKVSQIAMQGDKPYLNISATPIARLNQSHKVLIISQQEDEDWTNNFDLDFNLKTKDQSIKPGAKP